MCSDEISPKTDEAKKSGWEASKLRKLKIYTYVQNKLESLMKKDALLVDTLNGKRFDLKNPTKETYDLALATCLVRSGKLADDEIRIILRNFFRFGVGSNGSEEYFEKTVGRAHETIQGTATQRTGPPEYKRYHSLKDYDPLFMEELSLRQEHHKNMRRTFPGLDTGFPLLNEYIGGIQQQHLTLLTGRSGSGKTSFCVEIAGEVARREHVPCLYVSYTQPPFSHTLMVYSRLSSLAHRTLSGGTLTTRQHENLLKMKKKEIDKWGEFLVFMEADDTATIPMLRSLCDESGTKLLVIDSMEYIPSSRAIIPRYRVDEIFMELSKMAISLKMGIILIMSREDETPVTEYLGGDTVLQMSPSAAQGATADPSEISIRIVKNRFGEHDVTVMYEFHPQIFEFREKGIKK